MPRGTPAERLAARLDTSVTFVDEDGSAIAAQTIALDKQTTGVEIPGDAGIRGETLVKLLLEDDADVKRGYTFGLADGDGRIVEYRVILVHPPARGLSRVAWAEIIDY